MCSSMKEAWAWRRAPGGIGPALAIAVVLLAGVGCHEGGPGAEPADESGGQTGAGSGGKGGRAGRDAGAPADALLPSSDAGSPVDGSAAGSPVDGNAADAGGTDAALA